MNTSASHWTQTRLGELAEIKHGFAFAGDHITDTPTPDVLVTPGNFHVGGGFKLDGRKYFRGPVDEGFVLRPGEVIVTMTDLSKTSDTLGYSALVPRIPGKRFLHNQRIGRVIMKRQDLIVREFLYWLMRGPEYRREILAGASGTAVKHTAPSRIEAFEFDLPPLDEQRAIASILGTLDDKIELNRKMNETLETMARALFKSWFVDFDPVRAKAEGRDPDLPIEVAASFPGSFVDSSIGKVPKGWKVASLPEVIEINPTRPLVRGQMAPYLDMSRMPNRGHRPGTLIERPFGSGARFMNGDTLLARISPCLENGKTAFTDFLPEGTVGWGSTEFIVFRPRPPLPSIFGYLLARSEDLRIFAIQNMSGSSGRQRVPTECFLQFLLAMPPAKVTEAFESCVGALFAKIRSNAESSETLSAIRDVLLPKLLSGEVGFERTSP